MLSAIRTHAPAAVLATLLASVSTTALAQAPAAVGVAADTADAAP